MNTIIKKIVLTFSMMLLTIPTFAYDFEANGLYFKIISVPESTCELAKGDIPYKGDIVIPETVEYKNRQFTIVSIGEVFSENKEVTSIVLPNTIASLSNVAFKNCSSLKAITIPNSVTKISGDYNGYGCFFGCTSLQTIAIPNSVKEIGQYAFFGCTSLQTIAIPNSVKEIGRSAFACCTSLQTITISNSVKEIGQETFSGCTSLQTISIPDSVEAIGYKAFYDCTSLQTITISNSVKLIGKETFRNCSSLKTVSIPYSVETIQYQAFCGCKNLEEIVFDSGESYLSFDYEINGWLFSPFSGAGIKTISLGRELNFTSTRGNYIANASDFDIIFNNQGKHETLKILKGYDVGLRQITLFRHIINLIFEDGNGFNKKYDLTGLSQLQTLTLKSSTPPICPEFSSKQYLNTILYVPEGTVETYKNADGWKYFFDIREIGVSGVKVVQAGARRVIGRYDINGNRVDEDFKGITIVKFSDGSTKKIINR